MRIWTTDPQKGGNAGMKAITKAALGCLGAAGAWCALLAPRRNPPGWEALGSVRYAHRGLHDLTRGRPENSMAAFQAAAEAGFGAELDVHLMADGNLAVVHDSDLTRVCGRAVFIEDLTAADLPDYPLQGTEERIPLFQDVLAVFERKTPLIVELKVERNNAAALTGAAMALLKDWPGVYCVESFHPGALLCLKEKYPEVIRGQLSQNFMRDGEGNGLSLPVRFMLTHLLTTALTKPDFIAYNCLDRRNISLRLMKKLYGVREVAWTVRDRTAMLELESEHVPVIFEKFVP